MAHPGSGPHRRPPRLDLARGKAKSLQPQFDSLCTRCLAKLQAIMTDGGLPEPDAKRLIMNPDQLTGTLMAVASHRSLGTDQFLTTAADKIRTHVIDTSNLRAGQLEALISQTATAHKACLDAINDSTAMASQITKQAATSLGSGRRSQTRSPDRWRRWPAARTTGFRPAGMRTPCGSSGLPPSRPPHPPRRPRESSPVYARWRARSRRSWTIARSRTSAS
jgi:hypothetical protein